MTEKKKINVIIDGRNFTVVGSEKESYIIGLAEYVDNKIQDLANKNYRLTPTMAATLAALNIADEFHKASAKLNTLELQLKDNIQDRPELKKELENTRIMVGEMEDLCIEYNNEVIKLNSSNKKLQEEVKKAEEIIKSKDAELKEYNKMVKSLQDKIFDNEVELLEIKKELSEVLKTIDKEKNIFSKEGA